MQYTHVGKVQGGPSSFGVKKESYVLTDMGKNVAEGTKEKLDEVVKGLKEGTINVFDTANFTVGGAKLDSYKADVDTDDAFTPDTEATMVFDAPKCKVTYKE